MIGGTIIVGIGFIRENKLDSSFYKPFITYWSIFGIGTILIIIGIILVA
jgi:hypothetical protein